MFRILENTVTSFKRLGSQQETPSMEANSSNNSIKVYIEHELLLADSSVSSIRDPTSVPKLFRPRLLVGKINVSTPLEISYVAEPSSIDMEGGLGPLLFKLPGEIRNVIYSDLLSSGHPQFLRASKIMHTEGSGLIQENGIYRMNFGFPNSTNHSLSSQRVVDTIRHLDIRANVGDIGKIHFMSQEFPDDWLLQAFGGPRIGRDVCNVSFELYPSIHRHYVTRVCKSLRLLSGFERVVVRVKIDPRDLGPSTRGPVTILHKILDTILAEERHIIPFHGSDYRFRSDYKFYSIYALIRTELERNLGKPYFGRDEHGLCMIFHPRKALEGLEDSPEVEM